MIISVEERPHASMSPSSFERIRACTKSYQLAQSGIRRVYTDDARLGTAAHTLLEHTLRARKRRPDPEIEAVQVAGVHVPIDDTMRADVQVMLDYIAEKLPRRLLVEHQVALPGGYGWLDVASADPPWVALEYKNGFGLVGADTPQIGLYLVGLIEERAPGTLDGKGEALAVIIQPRAQADPVREHVWTYAALRALRAEWLAVRARIERGALAYADGPWCRWCPVAGVCSHLAAIARESVMVRFAAPELIASGEVGAATLDAALQLVPAVDHWVKQVNAVAKQYMLDGGKLPSFKLVKKRGGSSLTVTHREDPRPEVDVGQTLKAALRSSVALGYRDAARVEPAEKDAR
jgi:hypothetical protein